jgi:hypothetical protein
VGRKHRRRRQPLSVHAAGGDRRHVERRSGIIEEPELVYTDSGDLAFIERGIGTLVLL